MHDSSRNPSVGKQAVSMGSLIRSVTDKAMSRYYRIKSHVTPAPNLLAVAQENAAK
ncbi:MAG: hypothetical protein AB8Z31_00360 [Coxiella endosymbiont of Haemaphysalis qinghaiensis]